MKLRRPTDDSVAGCLWLARLTDMRASMTMGQPFPGVWLPREMSIDEALQLAVRLHQEERLDGACTLYRRILDAVGQTLKVIAR